MILGKCNGLCAPLILYVSLTIFSIIMRLISRKSDAKIVMSQLLVSSLWSAVLYILCSHCHERWAWALLTLPIILGLVLVMLLGEYVNLQNKKQDNKRENFEQLQENNEHNHPEHNHPEHNHPEQVIERLHHEEEEEEEGKAGPQPRETKYVQNLDSIN